MFAIGDRVHFDHKGRDVVGKVIKINSKTYVIAEDPAPGTENDDFALRYPMEWRVSPGLLALEGEPLPEKARPSAPTMRVGDKGIVDAPDSPVWHGQEVTIIKVNPTRYKTRLPNNSILNIPFSMVKSL